MAVVVRDRTSLLMRIINHRLSIIVRRHYLDFIKSQ